MTKKLLFVTTILLALAFAAIAADVSGKWVFEQAGRQGGNPVQVTLTLKAEGSKLSGTVVRPGRNGNMEAQITEGKVDGNNVSFKTSQDMGGNTIVTEYTGTLSGDDLKLKITRPGRDGSPTTTEATAKKSTT
ncbi:MAG TPA: hypothetical protein VE959_17940 [Bryobacteraceae bacterium]|nr:hypothetical protein [Bryobacteraceae bacterium]